MWGEAARWESGGGGSREGWAEELVAQKGCKVNNQKVVTAINVGKEDV